MQKKFQCFPEGVFYPIAELQEHLKFHFLPQCVFETPEERLIIREKGLHKLKSCQVGEESLELGDRFIDKIDASYIPTVSVRHLGGMLGHGLFTEEALEEGCYVGEYTGVVRKNDRRYFEPLNNYCYEYPVPDDIGRSYVIDASQGHLTRFINHSFHPNLRPVHVFYDGFYHLIFLALRRIEKGTQLSFDYGKNYWYIRGKPLDL